MASSRPINRNEIADKDVYGNIIDGANNAAKTVEDLNVVMTKTLEISNKTLQRAKPITEKSTAKEVEAVNKAVLENQKVRKAVLEIQKKELQLKQLQIRLAKQQEDAEKRAAKAQKQALEQTREGRKEKVRATQARREETNEIKREIIAEKSSINSKNALKNTIASLTLQLDKLEIGSKEYRATLKQVRTAQNQLNVEMEKAGKSGGFVGKYSRALKNIPSLLGITGGVLGFVQAVRSATRVIANFDSGLIKVGKTANLTDIEKSTLAKGTIALSRQLESVSTEKLFELQEVAGQLGVKGTDNLLKFSEVLARLEKSTNVVGQEGATALARIINITGEDISTVDRFGSALVDLGNNSAASEAEILDTANEVARATAAYDLASKSVLGISAALTSLGAKPEAAGSAIGSFFIEIEKSVLNGGQSLERFAQVIGITSDELVELFNKDKEKVFTDFIGGLSRINDEGGSVTKTLDQLDLSDKRVLKSLSPLATNFDILADSVERSNKAYNENTALTKESEEAFESLQAKIDSLGVSWSNFVLSIDTGNGFISQTIRLTVDLANEFLRLASGADDVNKELTEQQRRIRRIAQEVIFYTKVLGSLVAGFVAYRLAVRAANLITRTFSAAMAASRIVIAAFNGGIKGATTAMKAFNTATKANIIGLIASLLATAVTAFLAFRDSAKEAAEAQKEVNEAQEESKRIQLSIADIEKRVAATRRLNQKQLKDLLQAIDSEIDANERKAARLLTIEEELTNEQIEERKRLAEEIKEVEKDLERFQGLSFVSQLRNRLGNLKDEFDAVVLNEEGITSFEVSENQKRLEAFKELVEARIKLLKAAGKEQTEEQKEQTKNLIDSINKQIQIDDLKVSLLFTDDLEDQFEIRKKILKLQADLQRDSVKQSEDSEQLKAAKTFQINEKLQNDLVRLRLEFDKKKEDFDKKELDRLKQQNKKIDEIQFKTLTDRLDKLEEETKKFNDDLQARFNAHLKATIDSAEDSARKGQKIMDEIAREAEELLRKQQEQLEFTQSVIRQTSQEFRNAANLRNQELDQNIRNQEQALNESLKLAKNGDENLLAFRRQQLAKAQLERREELKRQQAFEEALQLSDIFLQSFSNRLSNVDANGNSTPAPVAAAGALSDTFLAKGLSKIFLSLAGFKEGTEDTGTVANPLDKDGGRLSILHDNERVFTKEQNKMIGGLSNPEAAQILYNHRINATERNRHKPPEHNPQIERLIDTINNKPVPSLELNGMGELVRKEVRGQIATIIKKRELKRYFNGN